VLSYSGQLLAGSVGLLQAWLGLASTIGQSINPLSAQSRSGHVFASSPQARTRSMTRGARFSAKLIAYQPKS